ncbi:MAG: serine hydroxymethyltransferase [Candidatus Aenigmarchaeota archaeon]|nr:serine hydroxymethyltransferase [Candidatus Aenigmarchaeota archaeon]
MEMKEVFELVEKQNQWRMKECINMIASENRMSEAAEKVYMSDFMHRYAEGSPYKRYYQGAKYIDPIEDKTTEMTRKLFGVRQAELRVLSGGTSNMAAFAALGGHGDILMSPGLMGGSHISHESFGIAGILGYRVEHAVFDEKEYNIDTDATLKKIRDIKPNVVTLGGSVILFPHPVKEVREVCDDIGAKLLYDAAHVLGLIAGKQFQDPMKEGAELMTSSTHKTFPGPQGGLILGNTSDEMWKKLQSKVFPGLISNHHLHRIPAMAITIHEMMEYGKEYAAQVVINAQALGQATYELGFDTLAEEKGFTKSHQILINVEKNGGGTDVAVKLENANIVLNKNLLACDADRSASDPSGLRIGVQEMTRIGMKEPEMKEIAALMKKVVIEGKQPEEVAKEVVEFRKPFQETQYCFRD